MRFRYFYWTIIVCALLMSAIEAVKQRRESLYVEGVAREVIHNAGARDNRSKVIALRDYLRERVTFRGAPFNDRPFLRATAAETLRSGKGYCGEVTRAFVLLAAAVDIEARRINLYGADNHVVAEAVLGPAERVVVDGQNPPHVRDLEPLDRVILRPEYDDYSTLHLRRLHFNWLVSRVRLELGPMTYWIEKPHAIKSSLWMAVAAALLIGKFLISGLKSLARRLLSERGRMNMAEDSKFDVRHNEAG